MGEIDAGGRERDTSSAGGNSDGDLLRMYEANRLSADRRSRDSGRSAYTHTSNRSRRSSFALERASFESNRASLEIFRRTSNSAATSIETPDTGDADERSLCMALNIPEVPISPPPCPCSQAGSFLLCHPCRRRFDEGSHRTADPSRMQPLSLQEYSTSPSKVFFDHVARTVVGPTVMQGRDLCCCNAAIIRHLCFACFLVCRQCPILATPACARSPVRVSIIVEANIPAKVTNKVSLAAGVVAQVHRTGRHPQRHSCAHVHAPTTLACC